MPLLRVVQDGFLLCIQHQCYTIDKLVPSFHLLLVLSNYKFQLALLYHHQFRFLGVVQLTLLLILAFDFPESKKTAVGTAVQIIHSSIAKVHLGALLSNVPEQ